jgi:hypothetical protein
MFCILRLYSKKTPYYGKPKKAAVSHIQQFGDAASPTEDVDVSVRRCASVKEIPRLPGEMWYLQISGHVTLLKKGFPMLRIFFRLCRNDMIIYSV